MLPSRGHHNVVDRVEWVPSQPGGVQGQHLLIKQLLIKVFTNGCLVREDEVGNCSFTRLFLSLHKSSMFQVKNLGFLGNSIDLNMMTMKLKISVGCDIISRYRAHNLNPQKLLEH